MRKLVAACLLALAVSACATKPYTPTPFDRVSSGTQAIVMVKDSVPEAPTTRKLATNGQNMASAAAAQAGLAGVLAGAIIAGVEAGIEKSQRDKMQAALAQQSFDGRAVFNGALGAALAADGFTVSEEAFSRDQKTSNAIVAARADAEHGGVLDISGFSYGYQLVGGATTWRPFVSMKVRLVDRADPTRVLMENFVSYNPVATPEASVNIPADEVYSFQKMEELAADPQKAAEGLQRALETSAAAVAQLLK